MGLLDTTHPRHWVPESLRRRVADYRGRGPYAGYPDRHQCIFIHIPKAAGTSVAQSLFGAVSRHVDYREYERANPHKFARYFKFTFVRNPWDRLLSAYSFLSRGGMNADDRLWAEGHLAGVKDFPDFVARLAADEGLRSWVHFRPQHTFICDESLRIRMDFIGRVEHMGRDFAYVADRLGVTASLVRVNSSGRRDYRKAYDRRTQATVADLYRTDIELFGYRFDGANDAPERGGRGPV